MNCHSECDCGNPSIKYYGPHDPDCHWWRKCNGEVYCDKHFQEAAEENSRVLRSPIGSTYAQTENQMRQELIDAGRGHLAIDYLADRADMMRMLAKDGR